MSNTIEQLPQTTRPENYIGIQNFDLNGELFLKEADSFLQPGITGVPLEIEIRDYGRGIQLSAPHEAESASSLQQMLSGDHLRVFFVSDYNYEDIYGIRSARKIPSPQEVYTGLKRYDRGWKYLMGGDRLEADKPYWLIIKWLEDAETNDRANIPDLLRLRIDPSKRNIRQVFTEHVISIKPHDSGAYLPLLIRDARLLVTTDLILRTGFNTVVLDDFVGPKDTPFSFMLTRNGINGYKIISPRPERQYQTVGTRQIETTSDYSRAIIMWGPNGIIVNEQCYEDVRDGNIIAVAEPEGGTLKFLAHTGTLLQRLIAAFEITPDGYLCLIESTEQGSRQSGTGQVLYAYQLEQQSKTIDRAGETAGLVLNQINKSDDIAALTTRNTADITLEEMLVANRQQLERLSRIFPHAFTGIDKSGKQKVTGISKSNNYNPVNTLLRR